MPTPLLGAASRRDFSSNRVNDPELILPIVEAAQARNLLLLVHSGNSCNCAPTLIADLASNFPKAKFMIANSAGFEGHQEAIVAACHQDYSYFDIASNGYPYINTNVVRTLGSERVVQGSDLKHAGLNSNQLDLILGKYLARLLRIEPKPSAPKTMDITQIRRRKVPLRIVGWCRENGLAYQSLVNEISAKERRTPRDKSNLIPRPRDARIC